MLKHHILTILRQLYKRRLNSSISLLSLTVGLTIFCLIVLQVRHELSYNSHWDDAEQVYRITHKLGGTNATLPPSANFSPELVLNITNFIDDSVVAYAEISSLTSSVENSEDEQEVVLTLADKAFLEVFALPIVAGSMDAVMDTPGFIALDSETAEQWFGDAEAAIGKRFTLGGDQVVFLVPTFVPAQPTEFEVAAVYTLPQPLSRSTQFQAIVANNAYSQNLRASVDGNKIVNLNLWVKLKEGVTPEAVNTQLDHYLDDYLINTRENIDLRGGRYSDLFDFKLQPLEDIYFSQGMNEVPNGDRTRLLAFGVVALLVLLAGSSNVISLGLAAALERRQEVGVRKAVGALQQSVMLQFMGEALILSLVALIPTVLLVSLLHRAFANLLSISGMPDPGPVEIAMMALICLCVGLINGMYPALILSRVRPVAALKSTAAQSRMRRSNLRSLLVAGQFCFAIVLLVVTLGLNLQLWVTRNQPLGFDAKNLAVASVNLELLQARSDIVVALANELSSVPGIRAVSPMIFVPAIGAGPATAGLALVNTQQDREGVPIKAMPFKPGLFDLLGIPLLAGRDLHADTDVIRPPPPGSQEQPVRRVIINRTALKALEFTEPNEVIGKRYFQLNDNGTRRSYFPLEVVGVVEDSMLTSVRERPGAQFYSLDPASGLTVLLRYDDAVAATIANRVSEVAQEVTGEPIELIFLDQRLAQAFAEEQRESRLLLLCAGLALFLSCVGLYGLVSVALKAQVKEIGVRKVLGASTLGVVGTFLSRFSVPVLVANLIAWPLAVYAVFSWIARFPYQLDKIWLLPLCLGTTALVLLIAWITVGGLAFRAASTRPVKSLRYE